MENVVPIEKLGELVQQTIVQINAGVAASREQGIMTDLPEEVQFDVVVIGEWQALQALTEQISDGKEEQGGGTKETVNSKETSTQDRKTSDTRNSEEESKRASERTTSDKLGASGSDTREDRDGGTNTTNVKRTSKDTTTNDNAHRQTSETSYTYGE